MFFGGDDESGNDRNSFGDGNGEFNNSFNGSGGLVFSAFTGGQEFGGGSTGFGDSRKGRRKSSPNRKTNIECKFFKRGSCRLGDACPYIHTSSNEINTSYSGGVDFGGDQDDDMGMGNGGGALSFLSRAIVGDPKTKKSKKVCHFWKMGTCKKGKNCSFAHPKGMKGVDGGGKNDKFGASNEDDDIGGFGSGFGSSFRSGSAGADNSSNNEWKSSSQQFDSSPPQADENVCRYYLRGNCRNGDSCRHAHPPGLEGSQKNGTVPNEVSGDNFAEANKLSWRNNGTEGGKTRKKVCNFWRRGSCKKGKNCKFAHPADQKGTLSREGKRAGSGLGNEEGKAEMGKGKWKRALNSVSPRGNGKAKRLKFEGGNKSDEVGVLVQKIPHGVIKKQFAEHLSKFHPNANIKKFNGKRRTAFIIMKADAATKFAKKGKKINGKMMTVKIKDKYKGDNLNTKVTNEGGENPSLDYQGVMKGGYVPKAKRKANEKSQKRLKIRLQNDEEKVNEVGPDDAYDETYQEGYDYNEGDYDEGYYDENGEGYYDENGEGYYDENGEGYYDQNGGYDEGEGHGYDEEYAEDNHTAQPEDNWDDDEGAQEEFPAQREKDFDEENPPSLTITRNIASSHSGSASSSNVAPQKSISIKKKRKNLRIKKRPKKDSSSSSVNESISISEKKRMRQMRFESEKATSQPSTTSFPSSYSGSIPPPPKYANVPVPEGGVQGGLFEMCHPEERLRRQNDRELDRFEQMPLSQEERKARVRPTADKARTIKKFQRSAAGKEATYKSAYLRPTNVLLYTLEYLMTHILDAALYPDGTDVPLGRIYMFVADRIRAVLNDLVPQKYPRGSFRILLLALRFYSLFDYLGINLDVEEFEDIRNLEGFTKAYTAICACVDGGYDDTEEAGEAYSYHLLLSLDPTSNLNFAREYGLVPRMYRRSPFVKVARSLQQAYMEGNYVRFFKLIRTKATALQCCIASRSFRFARTDAIYSMYSGYKKFGVRLDSFSEQLGFGSAEDALQFSRDFGVDIEQVDAAKNDKYYKLVFRNPPNQVQIKRARDSNVEVKLRGLSRGELMRGDGKIASSLRSEVSFKSHLVSILSPKYPTPKISRKKPPTIDVHKPPAVRIAVNRSQQEEPSLQPSRFEEASPPQFPQPGSHLIERVETPVEQRKMKEEIKRKKAEVAMQKRAEEARKLAEKAEQQRILHERKLKREREMKEKLEREMKEKLEAKKRQERKYMLRRQELRRLERERRERELARQKREYLMRCRQADLQYLIPFFDHWKTLWTNIKLERERIEELARIEKERKQRIFDALQADHGGMSKVPSGLSDPAKNVKLLIGMRNLGIDIDLHTSIPISPSESCPTKDSTTVNNLENGFFQSSSVEETKDIRNIPETSNLALRAIVEELPTEGHELIIEEENMLDLADIVGGEIYNRNMDFYRKLTKRTSRIDLFFDILLSSPASELGKWLVNILGGTSMESIKSTDGVQQMSDVECSLGVGMDGKSRLNSEQEHQVYFHSTLWKLDDHAKNCRNICQRVHVGLMVIDGILEFVDDNHWKMKGSDIKMCTWRLNHILWQTNPDSSNPFPILAICKVSGNPSFEDQENACEALKDRLMEDIPKMETAKLSLKIMLCPSSRSNRGWYPHSSAVDILAKSLKIISSTARYYTPVFALRISFLLNKCALQILNKIEGYRSLVWWLNLYCKICRSFFGKVMKGLSGLVWPPLSQIESEENCKSFRGTTPKDVEALRREFRQADLPLLKESKQDSLDLKKVVGHMRAHGYLHKQELDSLAMKVNQILTSNKKLGTMLVAKKVASAVVTHHLRRFRDNLVDLKLAVVYCSLSEEALGSQLIGMFLKLFV